jgi:hypothetical protein
MKNLTKVFRLALCTGLLLLTPPWAHAENAGTDSTKTRSEANRLIHWPKGFTPEEGNAFVHNLVLICHYVKRGCLDPMGPLFYLVEWFSIN